MEFTVASLTTISWAISAAVAGCAKGPGPTTGRHNATRTSRSRLVRDGGLSVAFMVAAEVSWTCARNTTRVAPIRISSPGCSACSVPTNSPLTRVPLEVPRSLIDQPEG